MRHHPYLTGCVLLLLCAFLYLWGLSDMPFYTKGEPREATVVWEIHTNGEWILPLRNGHIIPSKPPLFHWLGMVTTLAWGELTEWTIRFPSALLGIIGVGLTYGAGVALWGAEVGLMAGIIVATSFEWHRAATTARVDMTLTVFMVAAFLHFLFLYRKRQVLWKEVLCFYVLLGLATLAKGPVGAVLPGLAIIVFLAAQRDLAFLRHLHIVMGGVVVTVIAGAWYGLALWEGGWDFFIKQILQENLLRFLNSRVGDAGHTHPVYYYIPNLFLGMIPWSLFFPPLMLFLYQRRKQWTKEGLLYFVVWTATVFLFYSAASGKRSVYILPLYPAVALLLASWWEELRQGTIAVPPRVLWLMRASGYLGLALVVVVILGVIAQYGGADPLALIRSWLHPKDQSNLPLFTGIVATHAWAFLLWGLVTTGAAVLLVLGLQRTHWGWVFTALAAFTFSLFLLINTVFQPTVAMTRTYRPFMERVVTRIGDAPLFFYLTFDNGALYYAKRRVPFYDVGLVPKDTPYFLLMRKEEWAKIAPRVEGTFQLADVSEGTGPKDRHQLVLIAASAGALLAPDTAPPTEEEADEDTL
ncbi:MAG: glycosyltransferase family 39 protein [Deltaproteobacteria bacterium]|nr:glycosyltransferase family 39 protein [Deltaproteobacteria bacterium]